MVPLRIFYSLRSSRCQGKVNGKPRLFPKVKQDLFHLLQDKSVSNGPGLLPVGLSYHPVFEYKEGRLRDEPTPYKAPGVLQGFQLLGVSGISTTCVLSCVSVETAP